MKLFPFSSSLILGVFSFSSAFAEDVGWTRTESENTGHNLSFTAPSGGIFDSEVPNLFGFSTSGVGPDTPNSPTGFFPDPGEFVKLTYDFNYLLTDGTGLIVDGLHNGDFSIEVFGGTGVIDSPALAFDVGGSSTAGVQGVDFDFSGVGTQTLLLDNLSSGFSGFNGTFDVSGTWSGFSITYLHNSDATPSVPFDNNARVQFSGILDAEPVPEPSSSVLALLAGLTLLRRKR